MADINIKDVAIRAGVSTMTVTRTINSPELVKESIGPMPPLRK
ncbi:MAG: LacI family DNA-binding transcriptional regulator [Oscillospiraceae bacterium]|nr:LacI family DNA-binding transcriptional regulator [Oscillospiraceae bacterium]